MTAAQPHRPFDDQPPSDGPAAVGRSSQRALIQHELIRVRRQAQAARLEAQASRLDASAERLEGLLQRIDAGEPISPILLADLGLNEIDLVGGSNSPPEQPSGALEETKSEESTLQQTLPDSSSAESSLPQPLVKQVDDPGIGSTAANESVFRFDSWDVMRAAQDKAMNQLRCDPAHAGVKSPQMKRRAPRATQQDRPAVEIAGTDELPKPHNDPPARGKSESTPADKKRSKQQRESLGKVDDRKSSSTAPTPVAAPAQRSDAPLRLDTDADQPTPGRRRSAAFITSAVVHLILLIALAGFTLTTAMPRDQVALSASTVQASEEAIQTFQIETVQPVLDPSETMPEESQYDLDPLGELAVVEVTPGELAATSAPPPIAGALSQPRSAANSSLQALSSDSDSKMQFCGVEGGGNHFVYLVDSSGSMGDAFISARRALLESIDMLTDEQRFYVIFFDAQCDYMRITRADQDEPRSVKASRDNKQRLKSWAMRVEMDRGKAPYEPLAYALEKLKPDVIFLLSDGEFPQGIEDLIANQNRVSNLFGETNPVSIIHTISYHSREGESRMRRIAENNFGQYRHVPKP